MASHANNGRTQRRGLKAIVAGALGIALLSGGGITFAKWYQENEVGSATLSTGHLNFTVAGQKWSDLNHADKAVDPATFKMVPGDKLRYTATVTPDLVGDNLTATLKVNTDETVTGDLAKIVKVTTKVGEGTDVSKVVTPADKTPITVTVDLEFPLTTDGAAPKADKSNWWKDQGEDGSVSLNSTKIELIQNDNPAN